MSMIARVVEITSDRLSQLVADPSAVEDLFSGDNASGGSFSGLLMTEAAQERLKKLSSDMLATSLARMGPKGLEVVFDRLKRIGINIDATQSGKAGEALLGLMKEGALGRQRGAQTAFTAPATAASQSNGRLADLSLEKAWHGLHYLLCGAAEPDGTTLGNTMLGGTELGGDLGYGPARYFTADEVVAVARALTDAKLESAMRARFDPAKMVAAGIYPNGWAPNDLTWLIDEFHKLRDFYAIAAQRKSAIVNSLE
jgi:hypothetical protein